MPEDSIQLSAGTIHGVTEDFRQFASRVERQLRALGAVHPAFRQLEILAGEDYRALSADLGDLSAKLPVACRRPGDDADFVDAGVRGELLPHTKNLIGFGASLRAAGSIALDFRGVPAGSSAFGGSSLALPVVAPWTDPKLLRAMLAALIESGGCNAGHVSRLDFRRRQRKELDDRSDVDWMTYVSRPSVLGCLPADIARESFANGELVVLTPHLPDPDSGADLAAAKRLRDALGEFGLLEWGTYVIHGWPPDAEEQRYEQLISGAPPGRKYVVNCVEFDGYDPDRKVLLYAKLFRELKVAPKGWGLRGIDKPVLNEAHRQVRAAAKAGNVPIEWHIAFEEPARRAAELLAEFGGISPRQIQVFHTPLDMIRPAEGARP
jgi:hypothetical protein